MGTVPGMVGGSEGCKKYEKQVPPGKVGALGDLGFPPDEKKVAKNFNKSYRQTVMMSNK